MRKAHRAAIAAMAVAGLFGMTSPAEASSSERKLISQSFQVKSPVKLDAVTVEGQVRAEDPRYYDLQITVAGNRLSKVTVFTTDASSRPAIDATLLTDAAELALIDLTVMHRYEAGARICSAGLDDRCVAWLPVDGSVNRVEADVLGREVSVPVVGVPASGADLVIQAAVTVAGTRVDAGSIRIPFVGQVLAIA